MSGISFLSDNYIDDSNLTITTGSANAQFPLSNLKNDFTTKKFRSTGNSVVFVVDFLQFKDVDFIALTGDATETLGITAASVKLSVTLDFSLSTPYALDINGEYNIGLVDLNESGMRYAEVTLTGSGSYCEIGKMFIGKRVNLVNNSISLSSFKFSRNDNSDINRNKFGQKFINIRNSTKELSGSIEVMTQAEMDVIDSLYIQHGVNKPLWVILDETSAGFIDGKYKLSFYCYFTKDPSYSALGGQNYSVNISLELAV